MDSDEDADLARAIALSMQDAAPVKGGSSTSTTKPLASKKTAAVKPSAKTFRTEAKSTKARKVEPEHEVLVISSDEDEDDILEVPAPKRVSTAPQLKAAPQAKVEVEELPKVAAGPLSFLGDRAQMERERIARQKRLRGPSPPPGSSAASDDEDDDAESESGSEGSARKRARLDSSGAKTGARNSTNNGGNTKNGDGRRTFPDGALLRVDTRYATHGETPSIRLSEILGPRDELAFAVLSAFVADPTWLYEFFDPATPVVLVLDTTGVGGDVDAREPALKNIFPNWVRVCPPLHNGRGCMHMKYMLLFGKSGTLRVVVGSANLVPHDWRDMENYVFVQDFPPANATSPRVADSINEKAFEKARAALRRNEKAGEAFAAVLAGALRACGVEEGLRIMGRQGHTTLPLPTLGAAKAKNAQSPLERGWDWTRARVALVPSVAGRWTGWAEVCGTGQPRLMRAVQALGCSLEPSASKNKAKGKGKEGEWELELDCLTSSLGTYAAPWLAVFRLCAAGRARALEGWLDRGRGKKTPTPPHPTRVLFPTLETVRGTVAGEAGAGTVFCRRGQWLKIAALLGDSGKGAALEFRDARSRSGEVGMHTKMILGTLRPPPKQETDPEVTESDTESDSEVEVVSGPPARAGEEKPHAWLYVGSHNFTASAWGTLNGSGFNPVLNVTNYELGVVMRMEKSQDVSASVAWEVPARRYGRGDVPWIQEESPFFQ